MLYNKKEIGEWLDNVSKELVWSHGRCEKCGVTRNLTNSHIISRTFFLTRWDPRNLQCICMTCHRYLENNRNFFRAWSKDSSCAQYLDVMCSQAYARVKPDFILWQRIYLSVLDVGFSLVEAREWLDDIVLLSEDNLDF